jgi:hypothetical protein
MCGVNKKALRITEEFPPGVLIDPGSPKQNAGGIQAKFIKNFTMLKCILGKNIFSINPIRWEIGLYIVSIQSIAIKLEGFKVLGWFLILIWSLELVLQMHVKRP